MAGPGFVGDLVGAAGCDGQGNAFARGMQGMFQQPGMPPGAAAHMDPAFVGDELPDELLPHQQTLPPSGLTAPSGLAGGWSEEFMSQPSAGFAPMDPMAAEFLQQQQRHEAAAAAAVAAPVDWATEMQQGEEQAGDWCQQFRDRQQGDDWAEDFNNDGVQTFGVEGEEQISFEAKQENCGFFKFLDKVRSGEIKLEDAPVKEGDWAEEFGQGQAAGGDIDWAHEFKQEEANWAEDFANQEHAAETGEGWSQDFMQEGNAWAEEYRRDGHAGRFSEYQFDENNPYMHHPNPFQEGLDLLEAGSLAEAVLAFEATVQKESEHVAGWEHLGTTQAANEKDAQAVTALLRCRELDPDNSRVLMQLAVSYTNESCYADAIHSLKDWLLRNPRFKQYASNLQQAGTVRESEEGWAQEYFFVHPKDHASCSQMFEAALTYHLDPDVHIGLGVLYNISHEYDKAVFNFREALKERPNDHMLWNKLGATLANSNRSSEALDAYNRALDINPGYVRCLYNLGIAYTNLGEHRDAATSFLRSISMQKGSAGGDKPAGSQEMWDTLRMTLNLMQRPDLVAQTWKQDTSLFAGEFPI